MRFSSFFICITVMLFGCVGHESKAPQSRQDSLQIIQADSSHYTHVKWLDTIINIGNLTIGPDVRIPFHFINTGKFPLYIISVLSSCGCTATDYTQSAIMPGDTGQVIATYHTNGQPEGQVTKSIQIYTNTYPGYKNLFFEAINKL